MKLHFRATGIHETLTNAHSLGKKWLIMLSLIDRKMISSTTFLKKHSSVIKTNELALIYLEGLLNYKIRHYFDFAIPKIQNAAPNTDSKKKIEN